MGRLKIINALTVDVEDYFQVAAFADRIKYTNWEIGRRRVGKERRSRGAPHR